MAAEFDAKAMLRALLDHQVDFVVVGGLAGMARGSSYPSYDLDVAYAREEQNLERLAEALKELGATLRGGPADVPCQPDARALKAGANFTLDTPYGSLDILSDASGAPPYAKLKEHAGPPQEIDGEPVLVSSLDHLIAMKEATGRPKDKLMATEYRKLSDLVRGAGSEA